MEPRKRIFGHIPDYPPGSWFESRKHLSECGVHRQTQGGISGSANEGADSIVLSGGYEDDEDYGDEIIYTGQGGRNPEAGRQYRDQSLTRGNMALAKSRVRGLPVRVIRKVDGGYRYDGLFRVEDYWREEGKLGYLVWRYKLIKISGETTPGEQVAEEKSEYQTPRRAKTTILRIVRDTEEARALKAAYDYRCQICKNRLETPGGAYAEAAHIRPLGTPHNGPDEPSNLLCLCPNCHVLLEAGAIGINDNLSLIGVPGDLLVRKGHQISRDHLAYHRKHMLVQTDRD